MKAWQIVDHRGPQESLRLCEVERPTRSQVLGLDVDDSNGALIDVRAAGVSFPEVLQTYGKYQISPELPFVPGAEVAGTVRSAPPGSRLRVGDRVAAMCGLGGFAEQALAPAVLTFPLPARLDFAQGAALVLNYHTAYFSLVHRGRLRDGETVLVHGAAGGVGTAVLQVARALGATTVAVVSSAEKEQVARANGARHVVRSDPGWRQQVLDLTGGRGVDLVVDPVGGDRFTDSLRALTRCGRLVVVGFTSGAIPEVKVNRLLLRNTEVIGANWADEPDSLPELSDEIGDALHRLIEDGAVAPVVGARFAFDDAVAALAHIEDRHAVGKVVLERPEPTAAHQEEP